jgi:hypothetical protein
MWHAPPTFRTSDLDTGFFYTDIKDQVVHFHNQPTVLYCVPTNPGPRSFCVRPVRQCRHARASPFQSMALPNQSISPTSRTPTLGIIPRSQISRPRNVISDITLLHVSSSSSRPQLEPKYNLKATIPKSIIATPYTGLFIDTSCNSRSRFNSSTPVSRNRMMVRSCSK